MRLLLFVVYHVKQMRSKSIYMSLVRLNCVDLFVWKWMCAFLCELVFPLLITRWKFGRLHTALFYWIWQNFSLKLIYGQYPELIPGIHLGYIQSTFIPTQPTPLNWYWYGLCIWNAALYPCCLQSFWARGAGRCFVNCGQSQSSCFQSL